MVMFRDLYKSANSKIPVKNELVEDTKIKIRDRNTKANIFHNRKLILRFGVVFTCLAIVLTSLLVGQNILHPKISHGTFMFSYQRYNGKYYLHQDSSNNIQNKIQKHLNSTHGYFYEIKGVSTDKSIAVLHDRGYYEKYNYVFDDSITFMGKPYLLDPNRIPDSSPPTIDKPSVPIIGDYLGKAGQFETLPDTEISKKVAVKLGNNNYCIAVQVLSYVNLNGIKYEIQPDVGLIPSNIDQEFIGMAGPYKAYKTDKQKNDPAMMILHDDPNSIILHISDTEEVYAFDVTTPNVDRTPPPVIVSNTTPALVDAIQVIIGF